jgi:hypothetical protein
MIEGPRPALPTVIGFIGALRATKDKDAVNGRT